MGVVRSISPTRLIKVNLFLHTEIIKYPSSYLLILSCTLLKSDIPSNTSRGSIGVPMLHCYASSISSYVASQSPVCYSGVLRFILRAPSHCGAGSSDIILSCILVSL